MATFTRQACDLATDSMVPPVQRHRPGLGDMLLGSEEVTAGVGWVAALYAAPVPPGVLRAASGARLARLAVLGRGVIEDAFVPHQVEWYLSGLARRADWVDTDRLAAAEAAAEHAAEAVCGSAGCGVVS